MAGIRVTREDVSRAMLLEIEKFEKKEIYFASTQIELGRKLNPDISRQSMSQFVKAIDPAIRLEWMSLPRRPQFRFTPEKIQEELNDFWENKVNRISTSQELRKQSYTVDGAIRSLGQETQWLRKHMIYSQTKGRLIVVRVIIDQIKKELKERSIDHKIIISTYEQLSNEHGVCVNTICHWVKLRLTEEESNARRKFVFAQRKSSQAKYGFSN